MAPQTDEVCFPYAVAMAMWPLKPMERSVQTGSRLEPGKSSRFRLGLATPAITLLLQQKIATTTITNTYIFLFYFKHMLIIIFGASSSTIKNMVSVWIQIC